MLDFQKGSPESEHEAISTYLRRPGDVALPLLISGANVPFALNAPPELAPDVISTMTSNTISLRP